MQLEKTNSHRNGDSHNARDLIPTRAHSERAVDSSSHRLGLTSAYLQASKSRPCGTQHRWHRRMHDREGSQRFSRPLRGGRHHALGKNYGGAGSALQAKSTAQGQIAVVSEESGVTYAFGVITGTGNSYDVNACICLCVHGQFRSSEPQGMEIKDQGENRRHHRRAPREEAQRRTRVLHLHCRSSSRPQSLWAGTGAFPCCRPTPPPGPLEDHIPN